MKKKLLAAAVAGALASPLAFAQNVTIYGGIDVGVQRFSDYTPVGNANENFVQSGQDYTSRLGIRGSAEIAPGLTGLFVMEALILADIGGTSGGFGASTPPTTGTFWDRQVYGGIESKQWGALTIGRQYTHMFHTYGVGTWSVLTAAGTLAPSGVQVRQSNAIKYSSPKFGGLTVGLMYSPGALGGVDTTTQEPTTTTPDNGRYWDANVIWALGQFGVSAAHSRARTQIGVDSEDTTRNSITGKWDTGAFGIFAGWAQNERDARGALAAIDNTRYWIQPVVRFGGARNELFALWGESKNDAVAASDTTWWGVGYRHHLSKRTWAYAAYGNADNDAAATGVPQSSAAAATAGEDPTSIQLGIVTTF